MKRLLLMAVLAVALWSSVAFAVDDVTIDTMTVAQGATGEVVKIWLSNDASLRQVVVPIVFREVCGGAYPTAVAAAFTDRLATNLTQLQVYTLHFIEDGTCKSGDVGGFKTISVNGTPGTSYPIPGAPAAVNLSAGRIFPPDLPAGTDATGSFTLTLDVNSNEGSFEIDTTCVNPANHLLFVKTDLVGVTPSFNKGVITIGNGCTVQNQPPAAVCKDITLSADTNCVANATAADIDNGSNDPDGDPITLALVPAGPYSLGANVVQLIVTDSSGAADTCSATITVEDNTPPTLTCPGNIVVSNDLDSCGAVVNFSGFTATDACGGVSVFFSPTSGSFFPTGTTQVMARAVDDSGNADTCYFDVTVNDTQAPVVDCPADIQVTSDPGSCGAIVDYQVSVSDNCPGATIISSSPASGSFFDTGVTVVTTVAQDAAGNVDTCTFSVEVLDEEPPAINCGGLYDVENDPGVCEAVVNFPANWATATDNCDSVVVTYSPPSGSVFPIGLSTVTATATDLAGNTDTCIFQVKVVDAEPPVAECPGDTGILIAPGETEVAVTYSSSVSDNCSGASIVCSPPSGSVFPLGANLVTCIATDAAGNADTCTFTITVSGETLPPVALCTDIELVADTSCEADGSIDNGSNDPDGGSVTLSQTPAGPYALGQTLVTLLVTDDEGDTASCQATITVIDTTKPTIVCNLSNAKADADGNCEHILADLTSNGAYTASDNCGVPLVTQVPAGGTALPLGVHTIWLIAEDESGNKDSCSFDLTVEDNTPPVIDCPMFVEPWIVPNDQGQCGAVVDWAVDIATATDNCSAQVRYEPTPGSFFDVGMHQIAAIAEDDAGNADTCYMELAVIDAEAPATDCPANIVVEVNAPIDTATVVFVADAGDNCPNVDVVSTPPSGSVFSVGVTTVTTIATDSAGNADTCTFSVTVNQLIDPVIDATPDTMCFIFTQGGPITDSLEGCVDNIGTGGPLAYSLEETAPWLSLSSTGGTTYSCFMATADQTGMGVGTYYTEIFVCSFGPTNTGCQSTDTIVVKMVVESPCGETNLVLEHDTLCYYADECDTEVMCDTIALTTDAPNCPLDFSMDSSAPWITSITPSSGTTPANVIVCVDPTGMAPGFYTDSIEIYTNPPVGRIMPDAFILVKLTVNEVLPVLGVDSMMYTFHALECQDGTQSSTLYIFNDNPDDCNGADWYEAHNAPWLSVTPGSGTTPDSAVITVNPGGLAPGAYTDTITVYSDGAVGSPKLVIVNLMVEGCDQPSGSFWVEDSDCGRLGDTVAVAVNFCNDFVATGLSLGLHYPAGQVRAVGVDFAGSRVEYLDTNLIATIDDVNGEICLAAIPLQMPLIDTGCGLFATLYFEIISDEGCPMQVPIDSITIGQGCMPMMTDANFGPVWPSFTAGSVCIECGCELCGTVTDAAGQPLEGALVELWSLYPTGSVLMDLTTGPDGTFCFSDLIPVAPYDVRVVMPGYCPDVFMGFCGTEPYTVVLDELPSIPTQPRAADWWSGNATFEGNPLMPGDVITAVDPDGVICGVDVVENVGEYLILVVADDPLTPGIDEGAEEGDLITLYYNCECPLLAVGTWQPFGSTEFDAVFDCGRREIQIPLCDPWTLISFNVLPTDPSVSAVMNSIDGEYEHLLSATCSDGNISWDSTRPAQLNDLQTMDPSHGYWVKAAAGTGPIVIEGAPVPADQPLPLCDGWNAISYLPTEWDQRAHALASIDGLYEHVFTAECDGIRSWDRNRPDILNDLGCMKPGYGYWIKMDSGSTPVSQVYPTSGYVCNPPGLSKPVNLLSRVTMTPHAADFWSATESHISGLRGGDILTAHTSTGVLCGEAVVMSNGMFLIHVYGDDPSTDLVEGAKQGEEIVFEVNGERAKTSGTVTWNERGSFEVTVEAAGASPLPSEYSLLQNYPNPFNAGTTISFRLPNAADVTLTVYNVLGQPVRTLIAGEQMEAGTHNLEWDGLSDNGSTVQSGIYFYRLRTPNFTDAKKMTLLK